MGIICHPVFDGIQKQVRDEDEPRWVAQGWKPLLTADQKARLAELEREAARQGAVDQSIRDSIESHRAT